MPTYKIYERSTGQLCYDFTADAMTELAHFPFDQFDYEEAPPTLAPSPSIYEGLRKLTKLQWRKLLLPDEEQAFDRIRANVETVALPNTIPRDLVRTFVKRYEEATFMDLDDPDEAKGFQLLYALGAIKDPSRIEVILNG